jgi:hypothetical protein
LWLRRTQPEVSVSIGEREVIVIGAWPCTFWQCAKYCPNKLDLP